MKPATISSNIFRDDFRKRGLGFNKLTAQQKNQRHRKEEIDEREYHKRNRNLLHRSDGFLCSHHAVNDPGLAPKFGHYQSRFDCNETYRPGGHDRAQDPLAVRNSPIFPSEPANRHRQNDQHESAEDHEIERPMHQAYIWPLVRRKLIQTNDLAIRIAIDQKAEAARNG